MCVYSVMSDSLWTVAHQAPLSMGFPRQEYWSGLLCPSLEELSDPGIKPTSLVLPARRRELVVEQQSVERDVDLRVVDGGMTAQFLDVFDAVASLLARSEARSANIHRVGAVVYRGDSDLKVLRWRK